MPDFLRFTIIHYEKTAKNQRLYDLKTISKFLVKLGEKAKFTKFALPFTIILAAREGDAASTLMT